MLPIEAVRKGGLLTLTLCRPSALNALTTDMCGIIQEHLKISYSALVVKGGRGANGRSIFCAGGDVKQIWTQVKRGHKATGFFQSEYTMNYALSQAKKSPQISIWDGVVMGGGVGVSIHGKYRVSTENTVFAMPETAIGLFPDVGCSYVFPRLTTPGLGLYLGLTGASIGPDDVCRSGLATHFIKSDLLESVLLELEDVPCLNPDGYVQAVLDKYATDPIPNKASLALHRHEDILRKCFADTSSVKDILASLELLHHNPFAMDTLQILRKRSPFALQVTHAIFAHGFRCLSLKEALHMEFRVMSRCISSPDFIEGVRAVLVDKDRSPLWSTKEVSDEEIAKILDEISLDELQL